MASDGQRRGGKRRGRRRAAMPPGVAEAVDYARGVADRRIAAGNHVRLACERFLIDLDEAIKPDARWGFAPELAEAAMLFASQLPNIKGPEAGGKLRLMPWQRLIFTAVFGMVERGTRIRRYRQATVWVPRGNGKTTIAAPIALHTTFVEGEGGAEGYAAAVTRDQARIMFDAAAEMSRRTPEFLAAYGVQVGSNAISQARTASRLAPVSSDAKALDGLNVHVGVCDEIGSHKTPHVYDVLLTAMGKRIQPFLLSISTATGNTAGIGKQLWDYGIRVLTGAQDDDRLFALSYTIDEDDDPWDEASWIKANPGWGQSVQPDAIRAIARQARNNPAQEAAFKTRHLNVWVGADEALFSVRSWRECADAALDLAALDGEECHIALDLASKTDLAAIALVFPGRDHAQRLSYRVFARCYLNDAAVMEARNPSYPGWAAAGFLTVTPGTETDFGTIEADILAFCRRFRVVSIAYDPWAATQLAQRLGGAGLPMVEFRATTANFSEPTKELDAAMRGDRLRHDGNPVLEWCIGNVVGRFDARANVYPRKSRPEQKIDAAIATIMGIGRAMTGEPGESVYEGRGLLVIG